MSPVLQISEILKDYSFFEQDCSLVDTPLLRRIAEQVQRSRQLVFLLPAFPAKSPSPTKTSGVLPDLGEVLALQNLQALCERIQAIYDPGARVKICSDGRVFSDVVRVSDVNISTYQEGIESIIEEFELDRLDTFSLDDLFPDAEGDELRRKLLDEFALPLMAVRTKVKENQDYQRLFNGMHRFLLEDDLAMRPAVSKNKISQEAKERTYELMRRSDAWSELLRREFPDDLRLSIHPYEFGHDKFGVKLVTSSSKWATPWHNVTVKVNGTYQLMHMRDAQELRAQPKFHKDKYAYFEVASLH